jgi:hypothetical protein
MDHLAVEDTETFYVGRLAGFFKKDLIAEADPEVRAVGRDPFDDRIAQIFSVEFRDAIAEGADAGEEEPVHGVEISRRRHERAFVPEEFQDIEDVTEIAPSVIDDSDAIGHAEQ